MAHHLTLTPAHNMPQPQICNYHQLQVSDAHHQHEVQGLHPAHTQSTWLEVQPHLYPYKVGHPHSQ